MPTYTYKALNSQGQEQKGDIDANSPDEARAKLRTLNLFPMGDLKEKSGKKKQAKTMAVSSRKKTMALGGVSTKQLATFTRQLSTLINAGLPIVRSLRILGDQLKPGVLKNNLIDVADDVESGTPFSDALSKHPKTFTKLYVNMAKAGEAGGILDTILERLAVFMEKAEKLKKKVVSAMIYPSAVVLVAGGILILIIGYIVPQFQKMFAEMNTQLPIMTMMLVSLGEIVKKWWYMFPAVPFGLIVTFKLIGSTKSGRYGIDWIKMRIPLFGIIVKKSSISRFTRTLGTLIKSGVPILEALNIVKDATPNVVISGAIEKVHDSIREGESMAAPLRAANICDAMVVNMVDVGEETGELDTMLLKIADTYDEDVDALVGGLMSLIEPMLIVGLGGCVAFIVIALFLPMINLMQSIGK